MICTTGPASVEVPGGAWYAERAETFGIPAERHVEVLEPVDGPRLTPEEVSAAIRRPIDSVTLSELAADARSACIAVDDLARPTRASEILPVVLDDLMQGGLSPDRITIVVATGTHGAPPTEGIRRKLGHSTVERFRVEIHDAQRSTVPTGMEYGHVPLRINARFLRADLKLAIGAVLPHAFAGFSGGAKMMLPGLADLAVTQRSHKFVQMGLRGGFDPDKNGFRAEIESIARRLGFENAICVVPNSRGETAGLYFGDVVTAHRQACKHAAQLFRSTLRRTVDALILNAYPKDTDLVQLSNVFGALRTLKRPAVRPGGLVVLATAASEGVGTHGLFGPGGASYRPPRPLRGLRDHQVAIYAPSLSREDVHRLYHRDYPVCTSSDELTRLLNEHTSPGDRIGVLPCAPMQIIEDKRNES